MKRASLSALACALVLAFAAPAFSQPAAAGAPAPAVVQKELTPAPTPPPPRVSGPVKKPPPAPGFFRYTEERGNFVRVFFALAAIGLLLWSWKLEESGKGKKWARQRRWALAFVGLMGVFGWFNYGKFHGRNFVHVWEHYHYYMGAKYFPELRYQRLYECSAVAELEAGRRAQVEKRKMRDIAETNLIGSTKDIIANPERCTAHFTPARWEAFKTDVSFFYKRLGSRWPDSQKDHGYNGTPWWGIGGTLIANAIGPASEKTMHTIALIDPALVVLTFAAIWWAFGLEIFAVAATFFAVNFPSRFYWNGGAMLRYDYLFFAIVGICLLKKKKPAWGGAFLAITAAFRLFPVMFAVGPALQGFWRFFKEKKFPQEHKKILVGALVATALMVPASLVVARGGLDVYTDFAQNTLKHSDTPLTNHMGLRTAIAWRPWDNARKLKNTALEDPFQTWKEKRLENFGELKLLFLALNLAFVWAIWRTTKNEPAWVAAALSGTVLITSAAELTCYYYAFMIPGAFLMEKRKELGLWLILVAIGTLAITRLRLWNDEQYVLMSVASMAWGVGALWVLLKPQLQAEAAATPPAPAVAKR